MKCPACGFETPEEQGYCDFCKEPFRRPKPEPRPGPKRVEVPPELLEKLARQRLEARSPRPSEGIPPEFAQLDPGERIPEIPSGVRRLAWVFLGVCVLSAVATLGLLLVRSRRLEPRPGSAAQDPPGAGPGPGEPPPVIIRIE